MYPPSFTHPPIPRTHLSSPLCTHSHPQHKRSRSLDPHCSRPSWWVRRMIHSPSFSRLRGVWSKTKSRTTHMLIVTSEQMTQCSIPSGSPKLTVVVQLAKLGALVREGGEGVEDDLLLHVTGAQADALTGVLLARASDKIDWIMQITT